MRQCVSFRALVLMESESSARTADIAFLDSALELIPEDQKSNLVRARNGADSLYTRCLKRQRQRCYKGVKRTKAKQPGNEEEKRAGRQSISLNGNPAEKAYLHPIFTLSLVWQVRGEL